MLIITNRDNQLNGSRKPFLTRSTAPALITPVMGRIRRRERRKNNGMSGSYQGIFEYGWERGINDRYFGTTIRIPSNIIPNVLYLYDVANVGLCFNLAANKHEIIQNRHFLTWKDLGIENHPFKGAWILKSHIAYNGVASIEHRLPKRGVPEKAIQYLGEWDGAEMWYLENDGIALNRENCPTKDYQASTCHPNSLCAHGLCAGYKMGYTELEKFAHSNDHHDDF